MAAKTQKTNATSRKDIKPDYIVVQEWLSGDTIAATGDTYILEDVIEDTTSIAQDDNETNDIECETSDSPIMSIVKLGKWQFAAEVADTQAPLLKALMGFTEEGGKLVAPSKYTSKFVSVFVVFGTATTATNTAYVVPKLQLNSKLTMESLNTNLARIALAGTAQLVKVGTKMTPFYVDSAYSIPTVTA